MDDRKRKRILRTPLPFTQYFSTRYLMLCICCFIFLIFITRAFRLGSTPFRPAPIVPKFAIFTTSNSVQDLSTHHKVHSGATGLFSGLTIESRVLFNDHVLVILTDNGKELGDKIDCVYHSELDEEKSVSFPMLSADRYGEGKWIVRCPYPPADYSAAVGLRGHPGEVEETEWMVENGENKTVQSWNMVAYEAAFDGEDVVAVFVKGLQLKSDRVSVPDPFRCLFKKIGVRDGDGDEYAYETRAITAAQEVIRCPLPSELKANRWDDEYVQVTVEMTSQRMGIKPQVVPSIAKLYQSKENNNDKGRSKYKYNLCACTMVWNQAAFIREWVMYHSWLGIERWFVYDNNSDDDLNDVIEDLNEENYNVSRHLWPWAKSQEAGFSHCILRTRDQCNWVAFFDVDEFYYFPPPKLKLNLSIVIYPGQGSLQDLVNQVSPRPKIGDIRVDCHNYGPSGLKKTPVEGLISGYTCRTKSLERHKSIVRPYAVDDSLLNLVHHFELKKEFRELNYRRAVINHYKYQVWENFKAKFHRRVSTYVADWQENQNERSNDRVLGLGTEAIEPSDWHLRFCEVWDTRLRDFVQSNLADRNTGLLPWQRNASIE